jgi:hypothetical protein
MANRVKREKRRHSMAKCREVRDVFNNLRRKYNYPLVIDFIHRNYFIQEVGILSAIQRADTQPVNPERASMVWKEASQPTFNL